ncbi:dihydrofolate reductase family protein [Enterococcus alishanensis]|uniref:RibD family protein n=1 Tax=Enterococcus alishanensis TaxID=1303817 RepID=A0ABS6TDD7_9ENTE|nr:RibD family protein [Enterococcus alishanensis]MBV7390910.1 RibD family protein [Enterococcus alishanensis]
MTRPFIFCHMLTSLDGKITGDFFKSEKAKSASLQFYNIAFGKDPYYKNQGWLSGRVTSDDNFTFYKEPALSANYQPVPAGDFISQVGAEMYYISLDPSGKLGWEKNTISYRETVATVIEVLTERVSEQYKAFLRELDIPYIIAGKETIDPQVTIDKLQTYFQLDSIMLGGGGVINWSFIQAGVCDELSLVLAPVADGNPDTPSLFNAIGGQADGKKFADFKLIESKVLADDALWLRYQVE